MIQAPIRLRCFLPFLALLALGCPGTQEDLRPVCEEDRDCVPGATCEELRCESAEALTLLAASPLPPAPVGIAYSAPLPVSGGLPPLSYSLLQRPAGLSWLRIDAATGALSGTPASWSESPQVFQVSVSDRSRQQATKSYELTITRCAEGTTVSCFAPLAAGGCGQGTALCSNGAPGPCSPTSPSEEVGHCGVEGSICGACGEEGNRCEAGNCRCGEGEACAAAEACCGSGAGANCVDLDNDPLNCGGCGVRCEAGVNAVAECRFGSCVATTSCTPGFGACEPSQPGACVTNLSLDAENCGSCSNACDQAKSDRCEDGICACGPSAGSCSSAESCCAATATLAAGCIATDEGVRVTGGIARCGGCSAPLCPDPAGAGQATCVDGACGAQCDSDPNATWRDCDGTLEVNPPSRCDVNLREDEANCGACGNVCAGPINGFGAPRCDNGICTVVCESHYNACQTASGEMECRDQTSPQSCGTSCSPPLGVNKIEPLKIAGTSQSTASCASPNLSNTGSLQSFCSWSSPSEACVYAVNCSPDRGNCDQNDLRNGCEVDLTTSTANCGTCGNDCAAVPTPHSTAMGCETKKCVAKQCEANWARCDSSLYCDTPTNVSDVNNCGSCNSCPRPPSGNGSAVCNVSSCGLACNAGYIACGGDCVSINGPFNCGSCGAVCETTDDGEGGGQWCSSGKCCTTICTQGLTPPCRTTCE